MQRVAKTVAMLWGCVMSRLESIVNECLPYEECEVANNIAVDELVVFKVSEAVYCTFG